MRYKKQQVFNEFKAQEKRSALFVPQILKKLQNFLKPPMTNLVQKISIT